MTMIYTHALNQGGHPSTARQTVSAFRKLTGIYCGLIARLMVKPAAYFNRMVG
ncbi:MAG: hypothetical protein OEY86_12520 [Nitrospira sp.]|nr:hypothetical protein [Nitrospira sp.]